jgi:alpha-galactosidase
MRPLSATIRAVLACIPAILPLAACSGSQTAATSSGNATVSQSADAAKTWTIGNGNIAVTLALDPGAGLVVASIKNPATSREWVIAPAADTRVTVGSSPSVLGARDSPFLFSSASTRATSSGQQLDLVFTSTSLGLRATRHYVGFASAPVIETWTTIEATSSGSKSVQDLQAWQFPIAGRQVTWVTGLDPGLMSSTAQPFTVQQQALADGGTLTLGAQGRSSESAMPYFVLTNGNEQFFGGLEWSGAWRLTMNAVSGGTAISLGLPPMSTRVDSSTAVEGPHGFFGVATGSVNSATGALRTYIDEGLRGGRPFNAWVTSNTWFAHGIGIDAASMTAEIDAAAGLGAELFVVDAGYYPTAGAENLFDFTAGLGTWTVDAARFPDGLAALAQHAHDRGLKFGLWVEPERVALSTLGLPGLAQPSYLAKHDGLYDPSLPAGQAKAAQICLASAAGRAWVLDQLTQLIDSAHPDYLKWDNNFWINCNDTSHGHDAGDGNFQHVRGLYSVLSTLRARYPELVIENCSGGGNRLDFGMLLYTDVGWMDDRTSPAPLVRHNLEGLLTMMPPSYLLSFVLDTDANPGSGNLDVPLMFRSRMPGVLGLGFSAVAASDEVKAQANGEIALYKGLRDIQLGAHGNPLSSAADSSPVPDWDSLEEVDRASGDAVIFAFQSDAAASRTLVQPVGLAADTTYRVESADGTLVATATGAELMTNGIEVNASPATSAHVLILRADATAAATRRPLATSLP